MLVENISDKSSKNSVQMLDTEIGPQPFKYHYNNLQKASINFINNERYVDDTFKLKPYRESSSVKVKRLSSLYAPQTPLFIDLKTGQLPANPTRNRLNPAYPTYLSEMNMLPFAHFCQLIEPSFVNDQGYYHVAVLKDGVLVKEVIDDTFYVDENTNKIVTHPLLEEHPWVHIILKMWAKINGGYQNQEKCLPFQFIKTFSFPDWQVISPFKEKKQEMIKKLARATEKSQFIIAKTKNNPKVGYFGFSPNSASFLISGHLQQYGDIYIKLTAFTYDKWNQAASSKQSQQPEERCVLADNQFFMPLSQFHNIFHLVYSTSNKYFSHLMRRAEEPGAEGTFLSQVKSIHYDKYTLNVDAMESNAIVIGVEVQSAVPQYKQVKVGLSLYLPQIRVFDLVRNEHQHSEPGKMVVPWCKVLVGRMHDTTNVDASYIESVKQKMLDCGEDLISFVTHTSQHDYVVAEYFKGYNNELVHNLVLRAGSKYLIRVKIEQKRSEYRCFINTTAVNGSARIFDPKIESREQVVLLEDCLFKKAANQKKFITFVNPAKRGSWISCRDEYQTLGYSYIAVHVVKNADNKIVVKINPKKLKENGYLVKGHKDMKQYTLVVDSEENALIIIKYDKYFPSSAKRVWPPVGIDFSRDPRKK